MYEDDRFRHRAFMGLMSSTELYIGFLLGVFVACPALISVWIILKTITVFYIWSSSFMILYGISNGFKKQPAVVDDDCDRFK